LPSIFFFFYLPLVMTEKAAGIGMQLASLLTHMEGGGGK